MATKAQEVFQIVCDQLNSEFEGVISRDIYQKRVYQYIVEQSAMIATAHSPSHTDIGEIILKVMGVVEK